MREPITTLSEPHLYSSRFVEPGNFHRVSHFYERVLNAHVHPLLSYFFSLGNERIVRRYRHLHPEVDEDSVRALLTIEPKHFRWAGCDLFHVATAEGRRQLVVIETNSSPSGQKSMPHIQEASEYGGYTDLLSKAFLPLLKRRHVPRGDLAVFYDKNLMEASGYAAALADLSNETVLLLHLQDHALNASVRTTDDGILEARGPDQAWRPIRGALRYVTQRPWNRIPPLSRTVVFNPVLVCLAGGRNKLLAAKAYDVQNGELQPTGLRIRFPETLVDVPKAQVPQLVSRMGGIAVVKVPYSNAGQGVFTITSAEELEAFMDQEHHYDRFIVQALIGNTKWSSRSPYGQLYHVGTMPDRRGQIYVVDIRLMVGAGPDGFFPVAVYARRARAPLTETLDSAKRSWDMLGTNLSLKQSNETWSTDTERLLLMDSRDFNQLGLGLDDLIEAYVQTVLSVNAIDRMASSLVTSKGKFRTKLFHSINPDPALMEELCLR
ncbi:MAG: hypothetical protein H6714_07075 [Myxococcales bacterium]|nr:hypothetical protein [Myxococcales bacterium]